MADERKKGRPPPRVGPNGGTGARGDGSQPRGERGRADRGARTDAQRRSPRRTEQPRSQQGSDRRPERSRRSGPPDPPTDPDVTGRELDDDVRAELSTLSGGASGAVARHLVMAGRLLDDDPELAYQHALAARRRAARVGVVREAAGIAAYHAGRYAEALAELRAARRISGSAEYLPMMADSERGLGRPQRALDLASDPAVASLEEAGRAEVLIVAAGARRDLGQLEAAAVALQVPELRSQSGQPWVARLRYAYADALVALDRYEEARQWFVRAAESDEERQTDALERIDELDIRTGAT
jgi:tetratricopeptide (TPR) repeat protein